MHPIQLFRRSLTAMPLLAVLASCQKSENDGVGPVTELTLRDELEFSIAPSEQGALDLTTVYDAQASISRLLQEKGFSMSQLEDVRIEDARAVMIEPVNIHFNALQNVQLDFTQVAGTRLTFAHLDPVPADQGILELFVDHADLTPFFEGEAQTVHARMETSRRIAADTARVRFALTFRVKAGE
jgi:hypothetical protein